MPPITGPGMLEPPKPVQAPTPNGLGPMGYPSLSPQPMTGFGAGPAPTGNTAGFGLPGTSAPTGIVGYNPQGAVIPQSRPGFGSNDPTLNAAVDYANMPRSASPTPGLERYNNTDATAALGKLQEARQQQFAGVNSPGAAGKDYSPSAPVDASNPSFFGR